jgi:hypothetical protein
MLALGLDHVAQMVGLGVDHSQMPPERVVGGVLWAQVVDDGLVAFGQLEALDSVCPVAGLPLAVAVAAHLPGVPFCRGFRLRAGSTGGDHLLVQLVAAVAGQMVAVGGAVRVALGARAVGGDPVVVVVLRAEVVAQGQVAFDQLCATAFSR